MDQKVEKIAPRGEALLRYVHENLLMNAREGKVARIVLPPLVMRAYTVVNETGDMLVRNLKASPKLFRKSG
mgnify:CR=1 FL=1